MWLILGQQLQALLSTKEFSEKEHHFIIQYALCEHKEWVSFE